MTEVLDYYDEFKIVLNKPDFRPALKNMVATDDYFVNIDNLCFTIGQLKKLGYRFSYLTLCLRNNLCNYNYDLFQYIMDMTERYKIPTKRLSISLDMFVKMDRKIIKLLNSYGWIFEVLVDNIDTGLEYIDKYKSLFTDFKVRFGFRELCLSDNISDIVSNFIKNCSLEDITICFDNDLKPLYDIMVSKFIDILGEPYNKEPKYAWNCFNKNVYLIKCKDDFNSLTYFNYHIEKNVLDSQVLNLLPKMYISSKFSIFHCDDGSFSLDLDFRNKLLCSGGISKFNNRSYINNCFGRLKYQYIGQFYIGRVEQDTDSDDDLQSVEYVNNCISLIDSCDIFIIYIDKNMNPAQTTELIYAILRNKKVVIFYKEDDDVVYDIKSSCWFLIRFIKMFCEYGDVEIYGVESVEDVADYITK